MSQGVDQLVATTPSSSTAHVASAPVSDLNMQIPQLTSPVKLWLVPRQATGPFVIHVLVYCRAGNEPQQSWRMNVVDDQIVLMPDASVHILAPATAKRSSKPLDSHPKNQFVTKPHLRWLEAVSLRRLCVLLGLNATGDHSLLVDLLARTRPTYGDLLDSELRLICTRRAESTVVLTVDRETLLRVATQRQKAKKKLLGVDDASGCPREEPPENKNLTKPHIRCLETDSLRRLCEMQGLDATGGHTLLLNLLEYSRPTYGDLLDADLRLICNKRGEQVPPTADKETLLRIATQRQKVENKPQSAEGPSESSREEPKVQSVVASVEDPAAQREEESEEDDIVCVVCRSASDDANMLLCDECDTGYHLYCLNPPLQSVPNEDWFCPRCTPAGEGGAASPSSPVASPPPSEEPNASPASPVVKTMSEVVSTPSTPPLVDLPPTSDSEERDRLIKIIEKQQARLPKGWRIVARLRQNSCPKSFWFTYVAPNGKTFRSILAVTNHLQDEKNAPAAKKPKLLVAAASGLTRLRQSGGHFLPPEHKRMIATMAQVLSSKSCTVGTDRASQSWLLILPDELLVHILVCTLQLKAVANVLGACRQSRGLGMDGVIWRKLCQFLSAQSASLKDSLPTSLSLSAASGGSDDFLHLCADTHPAYSSNLWRLALSSLAICYRGDAGNRLHPTKFTLDLSRRGRWCECDDQGPNGSYPGRGFFPFFEWWLQHEADEQPKLTDCSKCDWCSSNMLYDLIPFIGTFISPPAQCDGLIVCHNGHMRCHVWYRSQGEALFA